MTKLLSKLLGLHLFCVCFTLSEHNDYIGMITFLCYAESTGEAHRKALKKLNRNNIMFTGNWDISIEVI